MRHFIWILLLFAGLPIRSQVSINWAVPAAGPGAQYGNNHPRICSDGKNGFYWIWARASDQSVFFSRHDGIQASVPKKLNPSWLKVAHASWMGPDLAARGDTVYVVMKQTPESSDTSHIYLVHSYDGGTSFSAPVRVDDIQDSLSRFPTLAVDVAGNPMVAYMKFNAQFGDSRWVLTRSVDAGNSFLPDVKASGWSGPSALVCDCCPGALVSQENRVVALYRDNLDNIRDCWAGISWDGGSTFSSGWNMDQHSWYINACPASGPDGVIFGDSLYSVFLSGAGGKDRVFLGVSSLLSASANPSQPLTQDNAAIQYQNYPRIDHAGKRAAVAWKERVNGKDLVSVQFYADLRTAAATSYDTLNAKNSSQVDIALGQDRVMILWQDDQTGNLRYRQGLIQEDLTSAGEKLESAPFRVFPNPAVQEVSIQTKQGARIREVRLLDLLGREWLREAGVGPFLSFSLAGIPAGNYLLQVMTENGDAWFHRIQVAGAP